MPCTHRRPGRSRAHLDERLRPGRSAAPGEVRLVLLPSGPDTVRDSSLRGTRSSTSLEAAALENGDLGWEFSPALADCRFRAPLVPRLARLRKSSADRIGEAEIGIIEPALRPSTPVGRSGEGGRRGPAREARAWVQARTDSDVREQGPESANARPDVRPARVAGGEGGIRTRDGLPRTAFPVRRHSPLGDLSLGTEYRQPWAANRHTPTEARGRAPGGHRPDVWRRGRDSNPRCFRTPLFESGTINHSDTSPPVRIPKVGASAVSLARDAIAGARRPLASGRRRWPRRWPRLRTAPPPPRAGCR